MFSEFPNCSVALLRILDLISRSKLRHLLLSVSAGALPPHEVDAAYSGSPGEESAGRDTNVYTGSLKNFPSVPGKTQNEIYPHNHKLVPKKFG